MQHPIDYLLTQPEYNQLLTDSLADIKRCQEWYLFDCKGNKILDLYAANTRAMFGHKPLSTGMRIKQRIDQGLWPSVPVRTFKDFIAHCRRLFPGHRYYCFAPSLRYALETLAKDLHYEKAIWIDPAYPYNGSVPATNQDQSTSTNTRQTSMLHQHSPATTSYDDNAVNNDIYHHSASNATSSNTDGAKQLLPKIGIGRVFCPIPHVDILLPIIPHSDQEVPQIIATSDDKIYAMFHNTTIPSGVLLAALLETIKYFEPRHHHKALRHTNRSDYISPPLSASDLPPSIWKLHKCYLWSTLPPQKYRDMYHKMLANNILIHPNPHAPSILPFRLPKSDYLRFIKITASINKELV